MRRGNQRQGAVFREGAGDAGGMGVERAFLEGELVAVANRRARESGAKMNAIYAETVVKGRSSRANMSLEQGRVSNKEVRKLLTDGFANLHKNPPLKDTLSRYSKGIPFETDYFHYTTD